MFLNRVILIGRIVTDIGEALKYTPSGIPVLQFRLAVDRPMSSEARQSGQAKQTDFINIVAWRQSAEFAANYLGKGRLVAVEGQLHIREYEHEGIKRRDAEVVVDNLKSLERAREGEEGGESSSYSQGGGQRGGQGGGTGQGYNNQGNGQGGRGGQRGGQDEDMDSGYGGNGSAAPAPAPARAQAAPARPAAAPARSGGRAPAPPPEDDMDDPFADN